MIKATPVLQLSVSNIDSTWWVFRNERVCGNRFTTLINVSPPMLRYQISYREFIELILILLARWLFQQKSIEFYITSNTCTIKKIRLKTRNEWKEKWINKLMLNKQIIIVRWFIFKLLIKHCKIPETNEWIFIVTLVKYIYNILKNHIIMYRTVSIFTIHFCLNLYT